MTGQKKTRNWFSRINGNTKQLLVICLIIFAVFSIMQPTRFPTLRNLESLCFQFPEPGLFTLGIGITMLTAGADLSIVAVGNLVATLCGMLLLQKMPQDAGSSVELMYVLLCFVIAVGVGLLCGCLNGLLVAKLGIFPILATLGTQNMFPGISSALTKGQGVFGTFPEALIYLGSGKLFGFIPMPLVIFLIALIVITVIIHYTPHGLKTQWFGSNRRASFYCGIDNVRTVFTTYVISSIIGALIVGQSAVEAKVVSPVAVIVVALAGICGYVMPSRDLGAAVRLCRLLFVLAAVLLGFYELMAALALLILHLGCLESFGAPYTAPFTDRLGPGGLTGLIKRPNRADKFRSPHLAGRNKRRRK